MKQAEATILAKGLAVPGDKILVIGGVPAPITARGEFSKNPLD